MTQNELNDSAPIEEVESAPDFNPARLDGESQVDYRIRQKAVKRWTKRTVFYKSEEEHNRDYYRGNLIIDSGRITSMSSKSRNNPFKRKFRATKKLKLIRGKYFYGNQNVTKAISKGINPVTYIQIKMLQNVQKTLPSKEGENINATNLNIIS